MPSLTLLDSRNPQFPPATQALDNPEGLLAAGGNLEPDTLLRAYHSGIFPWYSSDQPILWWSPDPRCVIDPGEFHASRSLARSLRRKPWRFTVDRAFDVVIQYCAATRADTDGTWITEEMIQAYMRLRHSGHAHSVEVWLDGKLVGGLYGVRVGALFCGESMFSLVNDASKLALWHLCQLCEASDIRLIDCQLPTPHLMSLGAKPMARRDFIARLESLRDRDTRLIAPDRGQAQTD